MKRVVFHESVFEAGRCIFEAGAEYEHSAQTERWVRRGVASVIAGKRKAAEQVVAAERPAEQGVAAEQPAEQGVAAEQPAEQTKAA